MASFPMEVYREFTLLPALEGLIRTVSPLITGLYLKRPGRYNVTICPEAQPLMTDGLRLLWIASTSPAPSQPSCVDV